MLLRIDILGICEMVTPKFAKRYSNFAEQEVQAPQYYLTEVKERIFPSEDHLTFYEAAQPEELNLSTRITFGN